MPGGPYVLLFVTGERGSGKSTRARVIKNVIDPTQVPLRFRPASRDDLAISAMRQWLPVYDNVSSIPQDMSDAVCVVLDGGGLGKRRLYSTETIPTPAGRTVGPGLEDRPYRRTRTRDDATGVRRRYRSPPYMTCVPCSLLRWSASRTARATIVKVGFAWPLVGKTEPPLT
jgi:energy-coupling factor transporter ATP-binding protein EcfA2